MPRHCAQGPSSKLSPNEVEALLARVERGEALLPPERDAISNIIKTWAHINERLQHNDLTLAALRRLLDVAKPAGSGGDCGSGNQGGGAQGERSSGERPTLPGLPGDGQSGAE